MNNNSTLSPYQIATKALYTNILSLLAKSPVHAAQRKSATAYFLRR